jgi:predicted RNA-binding protein with PUA-like domain
MNDMLHNKRRKSKGEKRGDFKDLHARNDARKMSRNDLCVLYFELCEKNQVQSSKYKDQLL